MSDSRLPNYIDLLKHWDSAWWTALNVFVLTQAALLAGLAAVSKDCQGTSTSEFLKVVIPVVGFLMVILWVLLLGTKRAYIEGAEWGVRDYLNEMYDKIEEKKRGFLRGESSYKIAGLAFPALFLALWVFVMVWHALVDSA